MATKIILNGQKSYELQNWLLAHFAALQENTLDEATALAVEALGFPITRHNIHGIAKRIGLKFMIKRPRKYCVKATGKRAPELHDLRMMVFSLAAYMQRLFDGLGVAYGEDLKIMAEAPKKLEGF